MKFLSKKATATFHKLMQGLSTVGDSATIDNAAGAFMSVHVDVIGRQGKSLIVSVAH